MKHHLPSLEALKVFESAARQLSFSLAADELCITKGAVSYQIKKLEESLDSALFRRSIRQVFLTDAGQQLLKTTQSIFADLSQTLNRIKPGGSAHDVHIAATTYVAMRWLSPRIARFGERSTDVSIVLQHSVNSEDFKLLDVDIAIRWCRCGVDRDSSRLLELPMPLFPVCSPRLLAKSGLDSMPLKRSQMMIGEFASTALLCEDRSFDVWQEWYGREELALPQPRRIIADANVRTQAAIDGQGWTMADALMLPELESGLLVSPFRHQLEGYGYALMVAPGRFLNKKARSLIDWLMSDNIKPSNE